MNRNKTIAQIGEVFAFPPSELATKLYCTIEASIHEAADGNSYNYANYAMKVIENLNEETRHKILRGIIPPKNVARTLAIELNPAVNQHHIDFIRRQQEVKVELAISKLYTCRKCHGAVTERQNQTRSGDEASTITVTCLQCGASYRP